MLKHFWYKTDIRDPYMGNTLPINIRVSLFMGRIREVRIYNSEGMYSSASIVEPLDPDQSDERGTPPKAAPR